MYFKKYRPGNEVFSRIFRVPSGIGPKPGFVSFGAIDIGDAWRFVGVGPFKTCFSLERPLGL